MPIHQRRGAVLIVSMQPVHHGLRTATRAFRHRRGAVTLRDLMQSKEALAAPRMSGTQGQLAQIRQRLAPAPMINT